MAQAMAVWQKLPNYLVLNFSSNTNLFPTPYSSQEEKETRDEKARQVVSDLLHIGEETGAVLVESQSVDHENLGQPEMPFSHYMVVNHQFLKDIKVYTPDGQEISDLKEDKIHLILPENLKDKQAEIVQAMREIITFHQDISTDYTDIYNDEIDVIISRAGQRIFNFNTVDFTQTEVENPVILVADPTLFGKKVDVLVSEVSQGHYLFKEAPLVIDYIEKHHLSEDFAGLTSGRELGLSKLRHIRSQLYLRLVGIVMSLLVFMIINYFLIMGYLESQKKKLVIWYLFGQSFLARHKLFLIGMFLLPLLPLATVMLLRLVTFPTVSGILLVDVMMYSCLLIIFEKRERLTMMKQGD